MKRLFGSLFVLQAAILLIASCATFKGDIPIETRTPDIVYISPANQDGKNDRLTVPVDIPEVKGLDITGYRFSVKDNGGETVYTEEVISESVKGIKKIFHRNGIELPSELVWTGVDSSGSFVNDGQYAWIVEAWDGKENTGMSEPSPVVVDNTPPSGTVSIPFSFFSPNNDGRQDVLPINQTECTQEDEWKAVIQDASGRTVRSFLWRGKPLSFKWDGTDSSGKVLPDGRYRYVLSSLDRAENSFRTIVDEIIIETSAAAISVLADRQYFSPNGDGLFDSVLFSPQTATSKEIAESSLTVVDSSGREVRKVIRSQGLVEPLRFLGKDEAGLRLPDGTYYAVLSVTFKNGDNPRISSSEVFLDTTPPYIVFSADYLLFSPDGDGRRDTVTLFQSSSVEARWDGTIIDARGTVIGRRSWEGKVPPVEWDGRNESGTVAPDGTYSYQVTSTDEAGNTTKKTLSGIRIDTRQTPVTIIPSAKSFSPNGDGLFDDIRFHIQPLIPEGITNWSVTIDDLKGTAVRMFRGSGEFIPDTLPWDGRNENGDIVEGEFTARLDMEYEKGNLAVDITREAFRIDVSPPVVDITIGPLPFSPDGDGFNDLLDIALSIQDIGQVRTWSAEIIDPYAHSFRTYTGAGALQRSITWDGLSDSGELVQSAEDYILRVTATDSLGNTGMVEKTVPIDILVLKVGDKLKIVISSIYFKPNTADYLSIEPDRVARNLQTLDRLADILRKYGGYRISLEGHAVRVYWNKPDRWLAEENEVLIPLSVERAETIKDALIQRGIAASRMTTKGYGGYQPVVPHSDLDNRWKNRRVEFILSR